MSWDGDRYAFSGEHEVCDQELARVEEARDTLRARVTAMWASQQRLCEDFAKASGIIQDQNAVIKRLEAALKIGVNLSWEEIGKIESGE